MKKSYQEQEKEIIYLKNNNEKLKSKNKQLNNDIYFYEKKIKQLEINLNIHKKNNDIILEFSNEFGINNIDELFNMLNNYRKDKLKNTENIIPVLNKDLININDHHWKLYIDYLNNTNKLIYSYNEKTIINYVSSRLKDNYSIDKNKNNNFNLKKTYNNLFIEQYKNYFEDLYLENEIYDNKWIMEVYNKNTETNKYKNKKNCRKKYNRSNQIDNINKVVNTIYKKKKNTKLYEYKKEKNKLNIITYNYMFNNIDKMSEEEINEFKKEEYIFDSNNSRLLKKCCIYNKIFNNDIIFNSNYVFHPSLFDNIKESFIELLIYKIELLCKNENIEKIMEIEKLPDEIQYIEKISILKNLNIKLL